MAKIKKNQYVLPDKADVGLGNVLNEIQIGRTLLDVKGDLIVATANDTPGRLAAGANGTVLTADSAEATGLKWAAEGLAGNVVGRQQRTTNLVTTGAITRVLDTSASVVNGRTYLLLLQTEVFADTVPATTQSELRITTNNTTPLTTSPVVARELIDHRVTAVPDSFQIAGLYPSTFTGTLRVVFTLQRAVGTGNVTVSAATTYPTQLSIIDMGATVAVSGSIY